LWQGVCVPKRRTTRKPGGHVWLVTLERAGKVPLHEQIHRQLRTAIEQRRLLPGTALPSSRGLAADLKVARATVVLAYEHLRAEGWLDARAGSATRVGSAPELPPVAPPTPAGDLRPGGASISARGRAIVDTHRRSAMPDGFLEGPRAFATGQPAVDLFPIDVWGRLLAKRWRRSPPRALGYGDPRGLKELREAIAAYLGRARGLSCSPDQVIITQGAQQGLDLLARVLLDPGDVVWLEEPGYPGARMIFAAAGARVTPVPVDDEGLRVDVGMALAPEATLAFVTPARQMPLGGVMSAARRQALLEWAAAGERRWIIEDDYDSEFRYAARQVAAMQAMDRAGSVVHVGTFTKLLFPALRLGYLVVPPSLVEACTSARRGADFASPYLEQTVLADFLKDGHFDRHLRRVRTAYRARLDTLERSVESEMRGVGTLEPADAGRAVVLWITNGLTETEAIAAAAAAGVSVTPLSWFCMEPSTRVGLVLGYGGLREREIRDGVVRLAGGLRHRQRAQ
jgi:GntR family transcriptional regulator/MocR family aminotransferase